jgi:hypothetical protein
MGNLVKPKGKPKNRQSFLNKILELAMASPTNLILKIAPFFRLFGYGIGSNSGLKSTSEVSESSAEVHGCEVGVVVAVLGALVAQGYYVCFGVYALWAG